MILLSLVIGFKVPRQNPAVSCHGWCLSLLSNTLICRQFQTRTKPQTPVSGKWENLFSSSSVLVIPKDEPFLINFFFSESRNPLQNSQLTNQRTSHREHHNKVCFKFICWIPYSYTALLLTYSQFVSCFRPLWNVLSNLPPLKPSSRESD